MILTGCIDDGRAIHPANSQEGFEQIAANFGNTGDEPKSKL